MTDPLYEHFNQLLLGHKALGDNSVIGKYFGMVKENEIHAFAVQVENQLIDAHLSKTVVKRAFLIIIESLQNIYNHGNLSIQEGHAPIGGCIVSENDNYLKVTVLNKLDIAEADGISEILDKINPLSEEELKDKYLRTLVTGNFSTKNGAGLGLITIRLKSQNPIQYNLFNLEEGSYGLMLVAQIAKRFE